jgi:hypothetical protein
MFKIFWRNPDCSVIVENSVATCGQAVHHSVLDAAWVPPCQRLS